MWHVQLHCEVSPTGSSGPFIQMLKTNPSHTSHQGNSDWSLDLLGTSHSTWDWSLELLDFMLNMLTEGWPPTSSWSANTSVLTDQRTVSQNESPHICVSIWYLVFSFWFHSVWQTLCPSTSLQMTQFHSFEWLKNIPSYIQMNLFPRHEQRRRHREQTWTQPGRRGWDELGD